MTADTYIKQQMDESGNVKALLWIEHPSPDVGHRVIDLKISAKLALKLYLDGRAVHYLGAERYTESYELVTGGIKEKPITANYYYHLINIGYKGKITKYKGVIEIYANDMPNYRLERQALK